MRRSMTIKTRGKNYQQNKIKKKTKGKKTTNKKHYRKRVNQFNSELILKFEFHWRKKKSNKTKSNWNACNVPVFTYTSNPSKKYGVSIMHSTNLSATKSHVDLINMHKTMRIECHWWELEVCEHNVRCQLKHTIDCVTRKNTLIVWT